MSVESLALVLHHSRAKGTAKVVLIGIANHDGDGGAWPYVETLASYANVSVRAAQDALATLAECPEPDPELGCRHKVTHLGEVRRYIHGGGARDWHRPDTERPNRYEVLVTCPEGCDGSKHHKPRPGWKRIDARTYVRPPAPVDNPVRDSAPGAVDRTGVVQSTAPITIHKPTDEKGSSYVDGSGAPASSSSKGGTTPPCTECSAPDLTECVRRQAKLRGEDKHTYSPRSWSA